MADEEKTNQDPTSAAGDADASQSLDAQLAVAREEARTNFDRFLRERADLENVKKRAQREKADALKYGVEGVIRDLLPMVDNLERAVQHARGGAGEQTLLEGVELTLKGIRDVLQRHGVSRIEAAGQPFDPNQHEAVAHIESDAHAPNSVMEELQAGYRLHDRLLRPAMVTVAKGPTPPTNVTH